MQARPNGIGTLSFPDTAAGQIAAKARSLEKSESVRSEKSENPGVQVIGAGKSQPETVAYVA